MSLDAKRASGLGQSRAGLPGMADRLGGSLENLKQPRDPWKIPPHEAAPEIAMMREDQRRECRHMRRGERGAVAYRVAIRRSTRNDGDAGCTQIEFRPATRE